MLLSRMIRASDSCDERRDLVGTSVMASVERLDLPSSKRFLDDVNEGDNR